MRISKKEVVEKFEPIKVHILVDYDAVEHLFYEVHCQTKGATVGQLGLVLVALEQVKKQIVEQSEDIEPTFCIEE